MASYCQILLLLVAMTACQSAGNQTTLPPPVTPPGGQPNQVAGSPAKPDAPGVAVATVTQALGLASGAEVRVTGLYSGWKGPCRGMPPTRSAWQLVETAEPGSSCVYVDGPTLPGVAPNATASIPVVVHGKYKIDGDVRYIEADSVEKK